MKKNIFDMNGTERAAALMVALGPSVASDILKHLDDDSIEKITVEIAKIDRLDPADREELIGSFLIDLRKSKKNLIGGKDKARDLLKDSFGEEKADEILERLSLRNVEKEYDFLREIDDDLVFSFLKNEQPQTIAVILSYLSPAKAGKIMKLLSPDVSKPVAVRMAKMKQITPEAAAAAARFLKKKYDEHRKAGESNKTAGGVDALVGILRHMPADIERKILDKLNIHEPELSGKIREKVFSFENIVSLSNSEVRILIDEIGDDQLIARALKGAGDEIRIKFMRNMSQNRATDIINDMNLLGPLRLSEVEESRNAIVSRMRELHDSGVIILAGEKELYVE
ncbi:MAG TPA: flagellar motor switch protein FliG [Spirochaetota bacterium]|nr:flagellar motor switch protein FliG [Spirochaetota bacterium]HRZ26450.1 flagellar motor switch protein FliG [Spirochaetota bacterium]HSA16327.1 flagellar motor switch protein FliG [Spirochaetota bacterium]